MILWLAKALGIDRIAVVILLVMIGTGALAGYVALKQVEAVRADRAARAAETAREAEARKREMEKRNAEFQILPPIDRCRALARVSGLPASACNER